MDVAEIAHMLAWVAVSEYDLVKWESSPPSYLCDVPFADIND